MNARLLQDWDEPAPAEGSEPSARTANLPQTEERPSVRPQRNGARAESVGMAVLRPTADDAADDAPVAVLPTRSPVGEVARPDPAPASPVRPAPARPVAPAPTASSAAMALAAQPVGSLAPVNAADKRIVNASTDINQLAPFKYPWAWEFFLKANRNHWTPLEISMAQDVHDYHHKLTTAERHVFENVLAYLTTSDILAMRNIGLAVMEKMSAPELQIYQARQVYEEALHTWTYQHCIESLGLDQQEIYNRYRVVPAIHGKIALANRRLERVLRSDLDLTNRDNLHEFALSYFFFAAIFEGCWFYNGFTPVFALQRRGLMKGAAEQLQYIMRDEVLHCAFGIRVVRELLKEEQLTLDPAAVRELWDEALAAETAYANHILQEPILGYNADTHIEQFRFIANRRARQVGLEEPFPGAERALPWLDEQANLRKEKNFFETRVTEYQTGGALNWE